VKNDGAIACWGENVWATLGNGKGAFSVTPIRVVGIGE